MSRILARGHRPEICLPGSGFKLLRNRGEQRVRAGEVELPFSVSVFERPGQPAHVYFCLVDDNGAAPTDDLGTRPITRADRLQTVRNGQRNLGQRSLEIIIFGNVTDEEADAAFRKNVNAVIRTQRLRAS